MAGFAYLLFRAPLVPGLLLMGAVARAGRCGGGPARAGSGGRPAGWSAARPANAWVGWLAVATVVAVAVLLGLGLRTDGVLWNPAAGSPWRAGTLLGDVLRWF